ncbi:MAG: MGMT family protein [Bacteroidales bacterium]|nr:MGMT family protein [Bacteroidales bacterium]
MSGQFFDEIYRVVASIPYGRVTTYGAIARYLGTGRSARMVGWALNKCYTASFPVPAHRVVNRKGMLTGKHYFGGEHLMRQLLEQEGAIIDNDTILNFTEIFWDPEKELRK